MKVGNMQLGLPDFMLKWNFLKTLIISGIIFGGGFFFGYCSFVGNEYI